MQYPKQSLREPPTVLQVWARIRRPHIGRAVWVLAALAFIVGDTASTAFGLHVGLVEAHPVAASILTAGGYHGMLAAKTAVYTVAYVGTSMLPPTRYKIAVPASLLLIGVAITAYNLHLIAVALSG